MILEPAEEEAKKLEKKEKEKDKRDGFNDDYWCDTEDEANFIVRAKLIAALNRMGSLTSRI